MRKWEMRKNIKQEEINELVHDYENLFYKVLRRCSVFPGRPGFEDALQELRLKFFLKADPYETRGLFEADNNIAYLFKYLLWSVIDEKRKKDPHDYEVQNEEVIGFEQVEAPYAEVELNELFDQFCEQLSPKEKEKARALLYDETISRQKRYRYRTYMKKHFGDFFKKA